MPSMVEADAVAYLQKVTTKEGQSVFSTLEDLVSKILLDRPADPVNLLEALVRQRQSVKKNEGYERVVHIPTKEDAIASNAAAALKLFSPPEIPIDSETGEPTEAQPPNEFEVDDIVAHGALLEAVGAGLGANEMYAAMLAAKRLGEDPSLGVASVRFFGKVLGTHTDYYIFETKLREAAEDDASATGVSDVPMEKGTGANSHIYFVANTLGGKFTRLPDVTPRQIKVARQLKRFVTGDLSAPVSAYPPFPGTEAHYLRAQIARIVATTTVGPVGYLTAGEDGALTKNEENAPKDWTEGAGAEAWCHQRPHLKKQGRCELHVSEASQEEGATLTPEESEEGPETLAPLDRDTPVGDGPAWTPISSSFNNTVKFQVAGIRSNLWPGAVTVSSGPTVASIYVGWGMKNAPFVPLPPPPVPHEYEDAPLESVELPPKPEPEAPPPPEDADADGDDA